MSSQGGLECPGQESELSRLPSSEELAMEKEKESQQPTWVSAPKNVGYGSQRRQGLKNSTVQEQITFNEARRGSSQISELLH